MAEVSVLKEGYESLWLQEGHFIALQFNQGWIVFMITGREHSNLRPYSLGSSVPLLGASALGNLSDWDEVKDSSNRKYLEPIKEAYLKQTFWGVRPPMARIFFQYPSRQDRWSLIQTTRSISTTPTIGYIDGHISPFNGPFSIKTEIWTCYQLYPAFNAYNPTNDRILDIRMHFDVMTYSYKIITDKDMVKQFLSGERRVRKHTVGGIDPSPAPAPQWLEKRNVADDGSDMWAYTKSLGY